jgi:hypothetical protein
MEWLKAGSMRRCLNLKLDLKLAIALLVISLGPLLTVGQPPAPTPRPAEMTTAETTEAVTRLAGLGYWIEPLADHRHESFRHALIAFQKVEGRPRTGRLTRDELEALRRAVTPPPLEQGEMHLEVDLYRQILLVVDAGGAVIRILPVSSGSNKCFTEGGRTRRAVTPVGRFKIERKIGGWRKSPLGLLYYPLYFYNGTAIHGNPAVPPFPASHGCIRLPMFAAIEISRLIPTGIPLIIHNPDPAPPPPPGPCPQSSGSAAAQ